MKSANDIKQLIRGQLDNIEGELVRPAIEAILVEPFTQKRELFGGHFICWVVAEHLWLASDFVTLFVYCEDEDSPFKGWGIVGDDMHMGMDSS